MFFLHWVADFCEDNNIEFILGHVLYIKAIHGGKAKNNKVNSHKIASLIRWYIPHGLCLSRGHEIYPGSVKLSAWLFSMKFMISKDPQEFMTLLPMPTWLNVSLR